MNIAIIDAELVDRPKHRFPNLASMKLSAYNKSIGNSVSLVTDYHNLFSKYTELSQKEIQILNL